MANRLTENTSLANAVTLLANHISLYKNVLAMFEKIPQAMAFEFQHALVHVRVALGHTDKQGTISHLNEAMTHLERGLLDGYKIKVFEAEHHREQKKNIEFIRKLIRARLAEYLEVPKQAKNPPERYDTARSLYGELCRSKLSCAAVHNRPEPPLARAFANNVACAEFFKEIHMWAQLDLVYSALYGTKSLPHLSRILQAVFAGLDTPRVTECNNMVRCDIVLETIFLFRDLPTFQAFTHIDTARSQRKQRAEQAIAQKMYARRDTGKDAPSASYHSDILAFYDDAQQFLDYTFSPFCDGKSPPPA